MDQSRIFMALSAVLILIIIALVMNQISAPSVTGYSVQHAIQVIKESGKHYQLGKQVGFIQPKRGDYFLLGKIAEQYVISSEDKAEPHTIDYKLYQIDVDEMSFAAPKVQKPVVVPVVVDPISLKERELAEKKKQIDRQEQELREKEQFYLEKEQQTRLEQERISREQREFQQRLEKEEQQRQEREQYVREQQDRERHEKLKKKKTNSLGFILPDKDSDVKHHASRESFFW